MSVGAPSLEVTFEAEIWHWRGPSPFHFVTVPEGVAVELKQISALVTYGWGMIPVTARIGSTVWTTSLFPKNGGYVVPVKDAVRRANQLEAGDAVKLTVAVAAPG